MKRFQWRIAICLLPLLGALAYLGFKFQSGKSAFKLGVDLAGGTILVYEVDESKKLRDNLDPRELASSIKRRIDPNDLKNITVRPVGENRVEIILPLSMKAEGQTAAGGKQEVTEDEVANIKALIAEVGSLEFRFLANTTDDREAIELAEKYFEDAQTNKAKADLLDRLAREGKPPPAPEPPAGSVFETTDGRKFPAFDISPHGQVTYAWVELDRGLRQDLDLDNAAENATGVSERYPQEPRNALWNLAAEHRKKGTAFRSQVPGGQPRLSGLLLYSREAKDVRLPEEAQRKKYEYFVLTREPERDKTTGEPKTVSGKNLVSAAPGPDDKGKPAVHFTFDSTGGSLFHELTSRNAPDNRPTGKFFRNLAIILDGKVTSAPQLNSPISTRGVIQGKYTVKEVNKTVNILRSGALPATLKPTPVSENTMGPTLGQATIDKGLRSVVWAFVAVLVFMCAYYRFAGFVASTALLANLILTVAVMALVNATFTLPGLAGLVLMLGMAVDANVLIYERLREERDRGATLALALRNGYDRALPTILDTHLTSIFTAIVLWAIGNDQLKGFGISLTIGLVISLFTSLYMTRVFFDVWAELGLLKKLSMARWVPHTNIDFMAIRNYWFAATILLTVFGLGVFLIRGERGLNIDFTGGVAYGGQLAAPMSSEELTKSLADGSKLAGVELKAIGRPLLTSYQIDDEGKTASLEFDRAAAPAEMVVHIQEELDRTGQKEGGRTARVVSQNQDEKSTSSMRIELNEPMKREDFATALERLRGTRNYEVTFPGEKARRISLIEPTLPDDVRSRLSVLPELSLEMIYVGNESEGNKSRFFNVRTAEKDYEIVRIVINRQLEEKLKRINLTEFKIDEKAKSATLEFDALASPAQVTLLLRTELEQLGLKEQARQFGVLPKGEVESGRSKTLQVEFTESVDRAKLKEALASTQQEFAEHPQPERLEKFDTQLAKETQLRALYAVLASWGAILLYLWFRFGNWTFGLAAVLCLMHDLFFTLGIIAFCHYLHTWMPGLASALMIHDFKIDFATVAALLTLVGYSVNDTIVVFDRIREVRGKNPQLTFQMINDSVNQTLSRTLLTSFITWLVVLVLYLFGGEGVHLFAFVMVVGVIVGTYSSIYIASPLLILFGEGSKATDPRGGERQPTRTAEGAVV